MKSSHYTCGLFSINISLMASKLEFYKKNDFGKLDISWGENDGGREQIFHKAYDALRTIQKVIIVAHALPETASTCFRMLHQITREARLLGLESRVVIPNQDFFDAAEATGFNNFYKTFLTELEALEDLEITDFYPLSLISTFIPEPDPIAA
jgi:anti-anti-sigma regulatory factor